MKNIDIIALFICLSLVLTSTLNAQAVEFDTESLVGSPTTAKLYLFNWQGELHNVTFTLNVTYAENYTLGGQIYHLASARLKINGEDGYQIYAQEISLYDNITWSGRATSAYLEPILAGNTGIMLGSISGTYEVIDYGEVKNPNDSSFNVFIFIVVIVIILFFIGMVIFLERKRSRIKPISPPIFFKTRFCFNCGATQGMDGEFCGICGTRLYNKKPGGPNQ